MVEKLKISSPYVDPSKIFCDLWPMTQASQTLVPRTNRSEQAQMACNCEKLEA